MRPPGCSDTGPVPQKETHKTRFICAEALTITVISSVGTPPHQHSHQTPAFFLSRRLFLTVFRLRFVCLSEWDDNSIEQHAGRSACFKRGCLEQTCWLGAPVNLAHVCNRWNKGVKSILLLFCNPCLYLTRSCTVISQDKITRAPEKMEALAVRPMLLGNHIKVMQSLNAAFCLQSGESVIGASEVPVGVPKHIRQKELGLKVVEHNFQIFRRNICRNACWKNE